MPDDWRFHARAGQPSRKLDTAELPQYTKNNTEESPLSQNLDTGNRYQYPRNEITYIHPRTGQTTVMHTANVGRARPLDFGSRLAVDTQPTRTGRGNRRFRAR